MTATAPALGFIQRRGTIRLQLTVIAAAVVAVVLVVAAVALVGLQRDQLTNSLDQSLVQRADALTSIVDERDRSGVIVNNDADDRAAQVVGTQGTVLAASTNLTDEPSLADRLPAASSQVIRARSDIPLEDSDYRVLTREVDLGDGTGLLVVIETSDDVTEAITRLSATLAIATPAVLVVLVWVLWSVLGRALRPVEAIRSEVAEITGSDMHRRVSVPARDDEISRLARTMNDMLDRVERAHERQRRFTADASHELRTPLTRIRTQVEVDLTHPDGADPTVTNELVLDETGALQQMIDDLLHLARSDDGTAPIRRDPVDLDEIVREEVRRARNGKLLGTDVEMDALAVDATLVSGDPGHLARAIRNLLTNATSYAASTVTIRLTERDGKAVLEIADDGPGVPEDDRQQIFERFTRIDHARTRDDGGTGLGLAIVKDIVDRHDGTVACLAGPDGGATFRIELPTQPT